MGMYSTFKTNTDNEASRGIVLDYGAFRVTVLRAGGSNAAYERAMKEAMKPFQRILNAKAPIPRETQNQMMKALAGVYADSVIIGWDYFDENSDSYIDGHIEQPDGTYAPYSREKVIEALTNLPDLFVDIQNQASSMANFVNHTEEVLKN